jgi:adenosine deaminase
LRKPLSSLTEVLGKFELFQRVIDRPEVISRLTQETCEDLIQDGTGAAEFRFSFDFMSEYSNLSKETILEAVLLGIAPFRSQLRISLIGIASRDFGLDAAFEVVDFVRKHATHFVGVDLAGDETLLPNQGFRAAFDEAHRSGIPITIHAGESLGPDSVWSAIEELHASRIGHGIQAIRDPKLVETLRIKKIPLEVCPTSNLITRSWGDYPSHPLKDLHRSGVRVSINTDDPGIFGVPLSEEYRRARKWIGLEEDEIECIRRQAWEDLLIRRATPGGDNLESS